MSELPKGVSVEYSDAKVRIKQASTNTPMCWYNKHVGETFDAEKLTWYENGKVTHVNYQVPRTPGGGYNGYLAGEDIEIL